MKQMLDPSKSRVNDDPVTDVPAAQRDGAASVDRALMLLKAFRQGDRQLTLTELASRTGLYKSTALRLLASLENARLIGRNPEGRYVLGEEVARLNGIYRDGFSLEDRIIPALRALVAQTGESAAFHIRQGDQRICLMRVDSDQLLRDHVRPGDILPLDQGAGGLALLAFGGAKGKRFEQIRRDGHIAVVGDRVPGLTGISAPVWQDAGRLVGVVTLTLAELRFRPGLADAVVLTARRLSAALGGTGPGDRAGA